MTVSTRTLRHKSVVTLLALPCVLALGCDPGSGDNAGEEDNAGGKADETGAEAVTPDQRGLVALGSALKDIGVVLNENEDALVAITDILPLGEAELKDGSDLREYHEHVDLLVNGLVADLPDAEVNVAVAVPGDLICRAFGHTDETLAACAEKADAARLSVNVSHEDGVFAVVVAHGFDGGKPMTFTVDVTDGITLDAQVSVPDVKAVVGVVEALTQIDLGAVKDNVDFQGTIAAHFEHKAEGTVFEVSMPEAVVFEVERFGVRFESTEDRPLVHATLDNEGAATLDIAVGALSGAVPAALVDRNKDTDGDEQPVINPDNVLSVSWGGFELSAEGAPGGISFAVTEQPLRIELTGDNARVFVARDAGSATLTGSIDNSGTLGVERIDVTYDQEVSVSANILGLESTTTISAGATIRDAVHTSALDRLVVKGLVKAEIGLKTKLDWVRCPQEGSMSVETPEGTITVTADSPDEEEGCIAAFFTRDDNGNAQYNYEHVFEDD